MVWTTLLLAFGLSFPVQPVEHACWAERPSPLQRVPAPRGYSVELVAVDGTDFADRGCRIAVKDAGNHVVYQNEGFNTRIHPESGRDVDNDGEPDLILGTDTGGGNRCCWTYTVLSLVPSAHPVATLDPPAFTADDRGRTVVWTTAAFYGFGGTTMAESPSIVVARQFRSGRLTEITSEYCDAMLAGRSAGPADYSSEIAVLTANRKRDSREAGDRLTDEIRATRAAAIAWSLQALYCGRSGDVAKVVGDVWPISEADRIAATLREAIAGIR